MADLIFERRSVAELRPYHRNPRRGNIAKIAESLQVNGQYRALCVNRGTHTGRPLEVLAGNHTLLAARDLGWKSVDVTVVDVDDDHAARIVAADNRTADLGSYDDAALAELLSDLDDLAGTGYDASDLDALAAASLADSVGQRASRTDPDHVPERPRRDPLSRPGDVWELGAHRLAVGDCRDAGTWDALMVAGEQADAVWTDPPYGVRYTGKTANALTITNDELIGDALSEFLRAAFTATLARTRKGACWYVASPPGPLSLRFGSELDVLGVLRAQLVWVKDQFVMGHGDYHYRHEPVFYGWTPGAGRTEPPDRKQNSVHEIARPRRSEDHPTMKPVELPELHLTNSARPGDVVADPFAGSGTTLIACHRLGLVARLIELAPGYADVICRRFQEHTGIVPVRDGEPVDLTMADAGSDGG